MIVFHSAVMIVFHSVVMIVFHSVVMIAFCVILWCSRSNTHFQGQPLFIVQEEAPLPKF
jgi:hypothetical protein